MAAHDSPSGGIMRGHGVAFALVAIFVGVALAVAYAASDGAIFGLDSSPPTSGLPSNGSNAGRAAVISSDSFDDVENVSAGSDAGSTPPRANATLTEEQRELLAMRDFPWSSVAGGHVTSVQDTMDKLKQADSDAESLALSDRVPVNVDRRVVVEDDDRELAEIIEDVIDVEIPIDIEDDEEQEQPPEDDEREEPQGSDRDDSDDGSQTSDGDSSEGSGDAGSDDDQSESGGGSGGNSTNSDPSENSGSDSNSTSTEDASIDG